MNVEERKNMIQDTKELQKDKTSDQSGHYDLDGVSYTSKNGSDEVVVTGDKTSQNRDKKESRQAEDPVLENMSSSEKKEQDKLKEQPQKMDREKNLDFEKEMNSEAKE